MKEAAARPWWKNVHTVVPLALLILGLLIVVIGIALPPLITVRRISHERNSSTSLKTLTSAQADFRANDRDGNKVADFWTYDVAGLYCLYNLTDTDPEWREPIKLIELSVAAADSNPNPGKAPSHYAPISDFSNNSTKAGYWYHALNRDGRNGEAYRQDTGGKRPDGTPLDAAAYHKSRFGFVAYPDSLSAGKEAFIINEGNTVYKQPLSSDVRPGEKVPPGAAPLAPRKGGQLQDWPTDGELRQFWLKLD